MQFDRYHSPTRRGLQQRIRIFCGLRFAQSLLYTQIKYVKKNIRNTPHTHRRDFLTIAGTLMAGLTFLPGMVGARWRSTSMGEQLLAGKPLVALIVVPDQATDIEKAAAAQLQHYLSQVAGSRVTVAPERGVKQRGGVYLGRTKYALSKKVAFDQLDADGYLLTGYGDRVVIAGGNTSGLLHGVYDFLEELGFRKFAPKQTFLPSSLQQPLTNTTKVVKPTIHYRTTSYSAMADQEYTDWQKLSSRSDWGLFVHTFDTLVPEKKYGESHPEYYSLINGKRRPGTQLCLSNPEVLEVLTTNLRNKIAEKPAAKYWSVSQDDNDQYCRCENCTALNLQYGGVPSGSIVHFVNQVAKAFPDKVISTLAYWYTRKAPKNIAVEPNVNIMLCNIESSREAPVFVTDKNFSNDLKDWGALAKDILIWDYNVQFTNYVSPFPNLFTIKPNIKFYADNNVNALFMQANDEPAAEMALLRSYLISKLMWNPEADDQAIIDDFVQGYFGAAGAFVRQYIDRMQAALVAGGKALSIFGDPVDARETYLSAQMMAEYNRLFDQAEAAVQSDPDLLRRVQTARLPIMYATIQIGRTEIDTPRSLFYRNAKSQVLPKPDMKALVQEFTARCMRDGVKLLRERSGTPAHYLAAYQRVFDKTESAAQLISYKKTLLPITHPHKNSKPLQSLTEGVFASYESWQKTDPNWVYYTGVHMEFVLDLGGEVPVQQINMDFLNPQAQPDWHLMALPRFVAYALSLDGTQYGDPFTVQNPHEPNPKTNPAIKNISIHSFSLDLPAVTKARYIKVHAESLITSPAWHIRSGQPISIYCDQIEVR